MPAVTTSNLVDLYISMYVQHGFSIIPTKPLDKVAAIPWKQYQERRPTADEIDVWVRDFWSRGYNVAIITGDVSGNLVVLDFDIYSNPDSVKLLSMEKIMGNTWVVETPSGGIHIYFRTKTPCPSFNITHGGRNIVEVRGIGRYVLAPPSIAKDKRSGEPNQYKFVSWVEEIPVISDDLPSKLLEIVREKLGIKPETTYAGSGDKLLDLYKALSGRSYRGRHPPCIERILSGLPEGMRNEGCVRLASYLLHMRRKNPRKVLEILHLWNRNMNSPPLPDREVESAFNSVLKHGYVYGCSSLKAFGCDRSKCRINPFSPITEDVYGVDWRAQLAKRRRR